MIYPWCSNLQRPFPLETRRRLYGHRVIRFSPPRGELPVLALDLVYLPGFFSLDFDLHSRGGLVYPVGLLTNNEA